MGYRRNDLQEAFFVPGDHAFRVWGFSTTDRLADVLRPGYFTTSGLLHLGELIYVRMQAQPPHRLRHLAPAPVHMALLMVVQTGEPGAAVVRLVQDFGQTAGPADQPAAPPLRLSLAGAVAEPPVRKRGRPAGSRSKTAPATNGHDGGVGGALDAGRSGDDGQLAAACPAPEPDHRSGPERHAARGKARARGQSLSLPVASSRGSA